MSALKQLVSKGTRHDRPTRALIYSEPKQGKSHCLAGAPGVLVLDAEQGSHGFDVARIDVTDWRMVRDVILELLQDPGHGFRTIGLDTLDSLERVLGAYVVREEREAVARRTRGNGKGPDSIGDIAFGRGWDRVAEEWRWLTEHLARLQAEQGLNVVALAHCEPTNYTSPEGDSYKRWDLRTHKKTTGVWKGWVEELLFLRQDVKVPKHWEARKGAVTEAKCTVLETRKTPQWIAGSRRIKAERVVLPWGEPADCWAAFVGNYTHQPTRGKPEHQREQAKLEALWGDLSAERERLDDQAGQELDERVGRADRDVQALREALEWARGLASADAPKSGPIDPNAELPEGHPLADPAPVDPPSGDTPQEQPTEGMGEWGYPDETQVGADPA